MEKIPEIFKNSLLFIEWPLYYIILLVKLFYTNYFFVHASNILTLSFFTNLLFYTNKLFLLAIGMVYHSTNLRNLFLWFWLTQWDAWSWIRLGNLLGTLNILKTNSPPPPRKKKFFKLSWRNFDILEFEIYYESELVKI